jgi:phage-related protein
MAYMPYNDSEHVRKTMDRFVIEFYESGKGDVPAEEFLLNLDIKMRAKILGIMGILQEKGNQLREPYSKHLEDGIFEIRGKVGTDISRVLYFFYYDGKIIFTNGFVKKTQKTPKSEIDKAKVYRKEYIERCEKNEKV